MIASDKRAFIRKYAAAIKTISALAGSLADASLTIKIPMIDAIKPIEASAKGNIIKLAESAD